MKRLTHERVKEIKELKSKKEHPDTEKYKATLEKGLSNLEKYKKLAVMTQNVLRVNCTKTVWKKTYQMINSCNVISPKCINVNVSLQGIILACKINWLDDPKLRDIAMTLEELPIPD